MSTVKWHQGHLVGFDTETTGVDPLHAHIVTAAIVHNAPGQRPRTIDWIIDPGVEIPAEAAAVHGWTNDRLTERLRGAAAVRIVNGHDVPLSRKGALSEIAAQCYTAIKAEAPLVVMNAAYDLTLLEAELRRIGIQAISARPGGIQGVVDPMVIEKAWDPYRKVKGGCRGGKHACGGCGAEDKTLTGLCLHYGVVHSGAHDASADAVAALRLVPKLAAGWPDIARLKLSTLFEKQVGWRREQSDSLRSFWKRTEDPRWEEVDSSWPLHTALGVGRAA